MISVAIVEAKRNLREGWKRMADGTPGVRCLGAYGQVSAFLKRAPASPPDVCLLGLNASDSEGASYIQDLLDEWPNLHILVMAARVKDEQIFAALRAGARGYLTQNVFPTHLQKAIIEVYQGGAPMSRPIAQRVLASFRAHRASDELSDREQEVYALLCEGKNYREIADALFVSPNTVRFHLKNIYRKLGVKSRHEATRMAYQAGHN